MTKQQSEQSMTNSLSVMEATLAPVGDVPFIDEAKDEEISGQQIVTFSTEVPDVESIPNPMDLDSETLSIIKESREHTIKDIICREYPIANGNIVAGGTKNDIIFSVNPLSALLGKLHVRNKVSQFMIIRANLKVRIEFTSPPTVGGAVMATFYPDLHSTAVAARLISRLQRSQAPRQEILLSTVKNFYMDLPWISPFFARNLITGTGNLGSLILSRIVPSNSADVSYKVYVQCDEKTLSIEYPTIGGITMTNEQLEQYIEDIRREQASALKRVQLRIEHKLSFNKLSEQQQHQIKRLLVKFEGRRYKLGKLFLENDPRYNLITDQQLSDMLTGFEFTIDPETVDWQLKPEDFERALQVPRLHMKKEVVRQEKKGKISGILDAGAKVATIASGIPVLGSVASAAAPILSVGSKIAGLLGFSKTIAEKPVRPIRWKPADSHLTNEGVLPSHSFGVTGAPTVACPSGSFGSEADEMSISFIERSTAIIDDFRVSTSTPADQIVYAVPCTLAQFERQGEDFFFTHQTWAANAVEKWMAKLIFDINFTGNPFHFAKLRICFNPGDTGSFQVGDTLSLDNLDAVKSKVVAFGEEIPNNSVMIEPVSTTAMKLMPTSRNGNGIGVISLYEQNRYNEECSFGMLYITVEVPLKATSTIVAQYVDFYVTFSTEDLILAHPITHLPFAPRLQMKKSKITTEKKHLGVPKLQMLRMQDSVKASRSERFELKSSDYLKSTAMGAPIGNYTLTCGDRIESIKNILNAFYTFCPRLDVERFQSVMIIPYAIRPLENQTVALQFRHFDAVDYFSVGYGFYKGSMNIRLAKLDINQPLGEVFLQSPVNNFVGASFDRAASQTLGYTTSSTLAPARSGTRVIPVFSEECTPDLNIPYYSPFHISRVSTNGTSTYEAGKLDNRIIIQPAVAQSYRIYRAVGDDFHLGTLTSLPPFRLDTLQLLVT
nr:MAG: hypothetical protein 2 [Picornavirales sp.]